MTQRQIELFLSLSKTKSFTETAATMFMTQPAVSQQIQALEKDIGCKLFIRKKNGLLLTAAGQAFYEEAASLLSHTNSVYHKVRQSNNQSKILRTLCYLPPIRILPDLVSEFSRLHPEIFLSISRADLMEQNSLLVFQQHDISIAFGDPSVSYEGLRFVPLYSGGMVCFVHREHRLAQKAKLQMEDLIGETVYAIDEHPQNEMFHRLNQLLSNENGSYFFPRLLGTYDSSTMAASGQCVCILPDISAPVTEACVSVPMDIPYQYHLGLYVSEQASDDIMDFCLMAQSMCHEDSLPPVIY